MSLIAKGSSPFKKEERIHLKDEYYALAKAEYIKVLKVLTSAYITVTPQMRESIISDIKTHFKSLETF
jgi:hypothetical protein